MEDAQKGRKRVAAARRHAADDARRRPHLQDGQRGHEPGVLRDVRLDGERARPAPAFRLAVPEDKQMYPASLPVLMSDAGVIDNGTPIPADEMKERLRKEILELSVYYVDKARNT